MTLIWWYARYYIRDDFMYVGVPWVHPWLIALEGEYIRLTLIIMMVCMLLYEGRFYVCGHGLGTSLADCS